MPPDEPDARTGRRSRRRFLLAGGGAVAALASSTAGCIATLPPLEQGVRYGRVDVPEPDPPTYRRWLPPPSALRGVGAGDDSGAFPTLTYVEPGQLGGDVAGESFALPPVFLKTGIDHVGVGYENYRWAVSYGPVFVVAADVDRTAVAETLAETGYRPAGSHRGFDLFDRTDVPRALAVGDTGFVFVPGPEGLRNATVVVDAATGAAPRRHETSETFALLSTAAGAGSWTTVGGAGDDRAWLADAWSASFDDEGVYRVRTRVYPEGAAPTRAAVEREFDDPLHAERELNLSAGLQSMELDVAVDGRIVTVAHRQSHDRFRETNPESTPPPQVTWGVDHDREAQTVTLRHEAGRSIRTDRLSVGDRLGVPDGDESSVATQFDDEHDVVTPGDDLTVDVSDWPDDVLSLVWTVEDGTERTILLQYDIE